MTLAELNQKKANLNASIEHLTAIREGIRKCQPAYEGIVEQTRLNPEAVLTQAIKDITGYLDVIDRFERTTEITFP